MVELQKALEVVDIKLPGHEVRELIRKHDTNVKDGKLDMVEFAEVTAAVLCCSAGDNSDVVFAFDQCPYPDQSGQSPRRDA